MGIDFLVVFHYALKGFREKEQNFSLAKPFPSANENSNIGNEASERAQHIASPHNRCLR